MIPCRRTIRTKRLFLLPLLAAGLAAATAMIAMIARGESDRRPNIVLIMADDIVCSLNADPEPSRPAETAGVPKQV